MLTHIEDICIKKGLRMTGQRRTIAQVLSHAEDHPDVESVYQRATRLDPRISLSTVYRTLRLFEEAGIIDRHNFGDGKARYEEVSEHHHDHIIDIQTGEVVEFFDKQIEELKKHIAQRHGFELVGHRLELYGVRKTLPPKK